MKSKKLCLAIALVMCLAVLFSACGGTNTSSNNSSSPSISAQSTQASKVKEKVKIKFYGKIVEYSSGVPMVEELQNELKDQYDIDAIQVDWANIDKVIRTGIASGSPADIYEYWPQSISRFSNEGMALDLTPYLEANNGEWKKTFIPTSLDTGKVDGKYYAVPLDSNFGVVIANADLLANAGVQVPDKWSWDQFLSDLKQIKDKTGVFPFANATDNARADWIFRCGLLSASKSARKIDDLNSYKVPTTDPIWATVFNNTKGLYDAGYMYPGKGAVTIKNDEVKAGFYQGKVAMMTEIAAGVAATLKDAKFKTVVLPWPSMGAENAVFGGCDGLFIPSNAPHKDDSVNVLKTYLGDKIQKIHADAGYPVANANVQITDPITKRIVELSSDVHAQEFGMENPKVVEYTSNAMLGDLVLGKGVPAVLAKMQEFIDEGLKAKK